MLAQANQVPQGVLQLLQYSPSAGCRNRRYRQSGGSAHCPCRGQRREYTFSAASADKGNANNKVYIGDMVDADGNLKAGFDLGEIARRIDDGIADLHLARIQGKGGAGQPLAAAEGHVLHVGR